MSAEADLFNRRVVRHLFAGQRNGFSNTHRLFALLMVELWRREYRISTVAECDEQPAGP
jgi:hypothetical protein